MDGWIWQKIFFNTKVSARQACGGWTAELQLFTLSDRTANLDHLVE